MEAQIPASDVQNINQINAYNHDAVFYQPPEHLTIEPDVLLKDCACVSQQMFGDFLPLNARKSPQTQQLALLRSNDTIELYEILQNKTLLKICTFEVSSGVKISKMIKVHMPGTSTDMVVIQIQNLKFITLMFDPTVLEFRTVCMHNFENEPRLKAGGKTYPRCGFLQPFYLEGPPVQDDMKWFHEGRGRPRKERIYESSDELFSPILNQVKHGQNFEISGFLFLADDTKIVVVQFKPQDIRQQHYFCSDQQNLARSKLESLQKSKAWSNSELRNYVAREISKTSPPAFKPAIFSDYAEVLVPPTPEDQTTFEVAHHFKYNEFLFSADLTATDLLFPSQIFDLTTSSNLQAEPSLMSHLVKQSEFPKRLNHMKAFASQMEGQTTQSSMNLQNLDYDIVMEEGKKEEMGRNTQLYAIRDIKVLLGPCNSQSDEDMTVQLNLFVLHMNHLDRVTCTTSKVPCMEMNIYNLNLFRAVRQFVKGERDQVRWYEQPTFSYKIQKLPSIELVKRVVGLSYYTKLIVDPPYLHTRTNQKPKKNDLIYFVSNLSIYAFRQERQTITEVQTSSIAKIVHDLNQNQRIPEKMLPADSSLDSNCLSVQNVINKKEVELRFDGCTRLVSLPNNRLLILMENQQKYVVQFRFDQADLDVAAVDFVPVKQAVTVVPNCISVTEAGSGNLADENSDDYLLFVSSYFNDQCLLNLKSDVHPPEEAEPSLEKRQRLLSTDSATASQKEQIKKKPQSQSVSNTFSLMVCDTLPTLSAVNNLVPVGKHLIVSSGHPTGSYVTVVLKENLVVDELQKMVALPEIKKVFTLAFEQIATVDEKLVRNLKQLIILTFENKQIRIWELTVSLLTELDRSEFEQQFGVSEVIDICKISEMKFAVVSERSVTILEFEFEHRKFTTVGKTECAEISKVVAANSEFILVMEREPSSNIFSIRSVSPSTGQIKPVSSIPDPVILASSTSSHLLVLSASNSLQLFSLPSFSLQLSLPSSPLTYHCNLLSSSSQFSSCTDLTQNLKPDLTKVKADRILGLHVIEGHGCYVVVIFEAAVCCYSVEQGSLKMLKKSLVRRPLLEAVYIENNQVIICSAVERPLVLTFRRNNCILEHRLDLQNGYYFAPLEAPIKPNTPVKASAAASQFFLALVRKQNECQLVNCKHPQNQFFDVKSQAVVSDGVVMHRIPKLSCGIKSMVVHQQKYLIMATFKKIETKNAPPKLVIDQGFKPKTLAPDFQFALELHKLPSFLLDDSVQRRNWKEMIQFQTGMNQQEAYKDFQSDEIVTSVDSIRLFVEDHVEPGWHEFVVVCTIKLETGVERVLYPSNMYFFKTTQDDRLELVFQLQQKRLITAVQEYRGKLLSVQKDKQDLEIVIQQIRTRGNTYQTIDDASNEQSNFQFNKFMIDPSQRWQPQTIQNVCNFISIEHDYIFVADAFKNFQVFRLKDSEELKREKQENSDIITLKKRFQSKIDSNCVGVWPINLLRDASTHLQYTSIFSCGQDGLLRIYAVNKSYKNLDLIGQFDLKDQVLKVITEEIDGRRSFIISTKRSGIVRVRACSAKKFQLQTLLTEKMSEMLPFRGGFPPSLSNKPIDLTMPPPFLNCNLNLANLNITYPHITEKNRILDLRTVSKEFKFLNLALRKMICEAIASSEEDLVE